MEQNDTLIQCFEWYLPADGSFWETVKALAPSFSKMGITAVWLPPAYKGAAGANDVGYGVYDLYDLGEFDQKGTIRTKYGTKAQYLSTVKALQKHKLAVIVDVVFNHRMGGDTVETVQAVEDAAGNREEDVSNPETIETWTKFTFPGRKGKYSTFTWDHNDFDGTDWDQEGHHSAIYRFKDKQWDSNVDSEDGNYDYLMGDDLDMTSTRVQNELLSWGKWYYDTVGFDGVRLDAVKHIEFEFFSMWLGAMNDYAKKNLFAVGEYWNGDLGRLLHYLDVNHNCLSLFDVPLHYQFYSASQSGGNFDMGSLRNNTLSQVRPMNAVTFVDNHDTQPGQALSSFVMDWFKPLAYAFILLRQEGVPCVFYGDLYGIVHNGIQPVADLPKLITIRSKMAYGNQIDYFDDQNVIGWTRQGTADHPGGIAVVMSDGPGGSKNMQMDIGQAGKSYIDVLGHQSQIVTLDVNGCGEFSCDGGSVSVWMPEKQAKAIQ